MPPAVRLREGRLRFTALGNPSPVSTRKAIYAQVVDFLYERHAPEFSSLLEPIGRRKVPFAALDPDSFWGPHQVKSSQYFIETNGSTQTLRKQVDSIAS